MENTVFNKFELKIKCDTQEELIDTVKTLKEQGYNVFIDSCYSFYLYNKDTLGEEYD